MSLFLFVRDGLREVLTSVAGNTWKAAFAFELIGTVFLLWMGIMAWQVNRDEYD